LGNFIDLYNPPKFSGNFFTEKVMLADWATFWANFFTKASGQPVSVPPFSSDTNRVTRLEVFSSFWRLKIIVDAFSSNTRYDNANYVTKNSITCQPYIHPVGIRTYGVLFCRRRGWPLSHASRANLGDSPTLEIFELHN
jgi:hypothetical protein